MKGQSVTTEDRVVSWIYHHTLSYTSGRYMVFVEFMGGIYFLSVDFFASALGKAKTG